uniref:Cysteine-rich PDZ-binding protein n=1 Tax=Apteryx owenii TaxID=8824 RepID=A0A8B9QB93_APTOW
MFCGRRVSFIKNKQTPTPAAGQPLSTLPSPQSRASCGLARSGRPPSTPLPGEGPRWAKPLKAPRPADTSEDTSPPQAKAAASGPPARGCLAAGLLRPGRPQPSGRGGAGGSRAHGAARRRPPEGASRRDGASLSGGRRCGRGQGEQAGDRACSYQRVAQPRRNGSLAGTSPPGGVAGSGGLLWSRPAMVCEKCEKKLGTVITPDTWKDGARNTTESGGRKLNENKALTSKKARFDPYGKNKFATCRICKSSVHQPGSHYCQGCAYKKDDNFYQHSLGWRNQEEANPEETYLSTSGQARHNRAHS